jgi:hypothetical protein
MHIHESFVSDFHGLKSSCNLIPGQVRQVSDGHHTNYI